jgi:23S rRNA (cytidine1920-2'-O)/16S rRNA (cytidine1409-2'-O)-methyltransferase
MSPVYPAPARPRKTRLDQLLVRSGLCDSREKAQRAILAGQVLVNRQRARKPSDSVHPEDQIELAATERYVSRGGGKLEHALRHFQLDVTGWIAIDLGASTGGFTDCLLQHRARHVCAVDVGSGQLAWKLRQDPRVKVMERTNARNLDPSRLPPPYAAVDLVVIDCSFISLRKIIPPAVALLKTPGRIVALIKPQFEAGKAEADKGAGVITDPRIHQRVLDALRTFVETQPGLTWVDLTESPLLGPAGNKEFLVLLEKHD